jgi:hypothetical protein
MDLISSVVQPASAITADGAHGRPRQRRGAAPATPLGLHDFLEERALGVVLTGVLLSAKVVTASLPNAGALEAVKKHSLPVGSSDPRG